MGSRGISYLKVSEKLPINVVEESLLVCWAGRAGSELGAGLWSLELDFGAGRDIEN